ncbi:hypothetical protein R1flu_012910 [Riccia fluitans]|uniref:NB-ARC domain-containing protein n=1 Tax=Riccia fluitans TaxID=41844 RepID=A0ABD1ZC88_9MARC
MKRPAANQVSGSPIRLRGECSFQGSSSGTTFQASDSSQALQSIVQGCTKLNDEVYELYRPASGSFNLELVFFHGFQTENSEDAYIRTWMTRDGSECWLNTWLVERFPQARILSVSYDSGSRESNSQGRVDMYLITENLVQSLVDLASVGQIFPVVLVGHCVGGLVLKAICLRASQCTALSKCGQKPSKQFLQNLRGAFFYSTPHSGTHIPVRAPTDGGGPLLEYLHLLNKSSARINDEFMKLRHKYECQTRGLYAANETRTSKLLHLTDQDIISNQKLSSTPAHIMVVEEGSGRFDVDMFFTISGVDHFTVCSPLDRQSSNFLLLVHFLEEILIKEESCGEILCHLQLPLHLISFERRLRKVVKLLDLENPKPIKLSLVGMDGIGKSTLTKQILMHVRNQFDFVCFLEFEDIQTKPKWEGIEKLVARNLFRGRGTKVCTENGLPWSLLKDKRVLVVADGVENQAELVSEIIANCEGLPLALKLLGCHLCKKLEMQGSRPRKELVVQVLRDALLRMRMDCSLNGKGRNQVWRKLRIIFDDLDEPEKTIFLDLASFDYYGPKKEQYDLNVLKTAWSSVRRDMDTLTESAIENLRDRCFLRCDSNQFSEDTAGSVRKIYIHPALRNMGRWISTDLTKGKTLQGRKELWELNEGGTAEKLETLSILLEPTQSSLDSWNWGSIQGFSRLRLLRMSHVNMREDYDDFSLQRNLGMLHMINCSGPTQRSSPWERFLPGNIDWPIREGEVKFLHRLSVLVFDHCNMVRLPANFHKLQNLRILRIHDESMRELPKTISRLPALEDFTLTAPVDSLPDSLLEMPTLRKMEISSCSFLRMWPTSRKAFASCQLASLVELNLVDLCALVELPDSFGGMRSLKTLSLRRCSALRRLPDGFGALQELRSLVIEDCVKLEELCESFHNLRQLKRFSLSRLPALQMLPINFGLSSSLEYLQIKQCRALMELPQSFLDIESLVYVDISACEGLVSLWQDREHHGISHESKNLDLFTLKDCPNLRSLPESFFHFILSRDGLLESLLNTPEKLSNKVGQVGYRKDFWRFLISDSEKLEILPETVVQLECLQDLQIGGCQNLTVFADYIRQLENLLSFKIVGCEKLETLLGTLGQLKYLHNLEIVDYGKLETLPETLGKLEGLRKLEINGCPNLTSLPMSLGKLNSLYSLIIVRANLKALPEDVGTLERLSCLSIVGCEKLETLPESLGLLKLNTLEIRSCVNLKAVPTSLKLDEVERLIIVDCQYLKSVTRYL